MKKDKIIILFILLFSLPSFSQNLVNNPSFENVNSGSLQCSWYLSMASFNAAINQWTCPTDGTTDVYNSTLATSCYCHPFSTNASAVGSQAPRTGNGYVNLCTYGNGGCSPWREYVQGSLSSALVPGQQYCVEFYVSMADYNTYASNNIGVYFTTSAWSSANGGCPYLVTPQLNHTGIITDQTGWTLVSFNFTPTAAFTHFTIGNFFNDASTSVINVGGSKGVTRYYVDDVSIQLCSVNPVITVNSPTICAGQTATLTANSSIAGTTYNWSTGATTNPITVSPATTTTYTVTGTAGGNTGTATAVVTVNPLPTVTVNSPTICAGQTATLTAGGASTYNWSTGSTVNPVNVSPATTTTYTVTGTSAAGCTNNTTSVVTLNPVPVITVNSPTICAGQTATLTAVGGTTYAWNTGSTANPLNVSPGATTTYTVSGTTSGCTGSATSVVTVNPVPSITVNSPVICVSETVNLTASGGTTYSWSTGETTNPISVSPGTTTTYTVSGTTSGCTGSATTVVTVNPLPNAVITASTDVSCGLSNGSATASGGTSYNWSNGQTSATATGLSAQTYYCTVTANGCDSVISVVINSIPGYTVSTTFTDEFCSASNGTATVTPNSAGTYGYLWSNGQSSNTITGLQAGTYVVTVTDAYGCTATASVTIANHPGPTLTITNVVNETCSSSNGAMEATPSGGTAPLTYLWSSGQSTAAISGLNAGSYTVTVTDTYGCSVTASQIITNTPAPVISLVSVQNCLCGATDGGITVSIAGGTASLTYSWSNGQITQNLTNVPGGTYTLIVTDAAGCSDTLTETVDVIGGPQATLLPVNAYCEMNNGSITANVTGGTGNYTYLWSNGQTTSSISGLGAGTYTVTVDDGNCTTSVSCTLTSSPNPVADFTLNPSITDMDNPDISFFNNSSGATLYAWSFGDGTTSSSLNPEHTYTQPGTYTVVLTVTNDQGCTDSIMNTVLIKDPFALWVPNAFTPDGDGMNDYFGPKGTNIDPDHYQFFIYNRWGEQLFNTKDINFRWDGKQNGNVCKEDVYVWVIILKVSERKYQKYQGHVTLIR